MPERFSPALAKAKIGSTPKATPGCNCLFEVVRRRRTVRRIERHQNTDDDTGECKVDVGLQNAHPDGHADEHVGCPVGHAQQIEHDEASHPDAGQDQCRQRQLGSVEHRDKMIARDRR